MKLIICSFSSTQILAPQIVAPLRLLLLSLAHFIPLPPALFSSCYFFPHLTKASLYYLINLQANFFLRHALHVIPSSVTKKSSSAKWPATPDVLGLTQNHLFMCPARGIGLIFAAVWWFWKTVSKIGHLLLFADLVTKSEVTVARSCTWITCSWCRCNRQVLTLSYQNSRDLSKGTIDFTLCSI